MVDQPTLNAEVRLVEMTSRMTYEMDPESNEWKIVSKDKPVTEQFNEWANQRDMNPHGSCVITQSQFVESPTRVTIAYTLCAAVMSRRDQTLLELAYREQIGRLLSAAALPAGPETQMARPPALSPKIPTAAGAVAGAGQPSPASTPVQVHALGEEVPDVPERITFPAKPLPNPGVTQ
jgi:hypothetical protein